MVEWKRVAEPQPDQYDSFVALRFATTETTVFRPEPYVRRPTGDDPVIFDGRVAVRYITDNCPGFPRLMHGPLDHPNTHVAVEYLRRWPVAFEQFKILMDSFHPMVDTSLPPSEWKEGIGSASH